jgi:hypothetical protein
VIAGFTPGAFAGQEQVQLLQVRCCCGAIDKLTPLPLAHWLPSPAACGGVLCAQPPLQRLARAFDRLSDDPPDLAGLHILICHKTALDAQGTLCLDAGVRLALQPTPVQLVCARVWHADVRSPLYGWIGARHHHSPCPLAAAGAGAEEWAGFLGGVDPDWARDRAASAAALRQLEGDVAGAVGVRMLFTAAPYLMTHEYRCCWTGLGELVWRCC